MLMKGAFEEKKKEKKKRKEWVNSENALKKKKKKEWEWVKGCWEEADKKGSSCKKNVKSTIKYLGVMY